MSNKREISLEGKKKPNQPHFVDLEGQKFGKWTVTKYLGSRDVNGKKIGAYWLCICNCPLKTERAVRSADLTFGKSNSCGCMVAIAATTHGMCLSPEYKSYWAAKSRCENSNIGEYYQYYGGRGIEFKFNSFEEFLEELGEMPEPKEDYSVDRIDVNGNYEIGNCRWATKKVQSRNRRDNRVITWNGESHCIIEWSEILNINSRTLLGRLNNNWCLNCTFTLPVKKHRMNTCPHR